MRSKLNFVHPNFIIGVLFSSVFILVGCNEDKELSNDKMIFLTPVDSLNFNYASDSWKKSNPDYSENRYGYAIFLDTNDAFCYVSIDSDNQLHKFNFKTNIHSYSEKICTEKIEAYKLDSTSIYLLYNNTFYIKNYQLKTIDSFKYQSPIINKKHAIDFSVENSANLFKVKDYFALMYYVVDEMPDGTNLYRNSDYLFYFFNRDTAFFASKGCQELDTSFQYFRYPAITSDSEYLYHSPRVMNCISKSNNVSTIINSKIDTIRKNYLSINHSDQYKISKLKKYRFSTDYNRDLILSGKYLYLIKEILDKIYYKDNVRKYEHVLEIKKFDKQLKHIRTFYIQDKIYSFAYIKEEKLYLFDIYKNKALIYDL